MSPSRRRAGRPSLQFSHAHSASLALEKPVLHSCFTHPWRLPGVRSLMSHPSTPTARTRVVREADRAVYDREAVYKILDEGFICHVGFNVDGQPFVIPTSYGRSGDNLYRSEERRVGKGCRAGRGRES